MLIVQSHQCYAFVGGRYYTARYGGGMACGSTCPLIAAWLALEAAGRTDGR